MTMPLTLSVKHERFCLGVASGKNATRAYIDAGYSPKGADVSASRLLGVAGISQRISELRSKTEDSMECKRINFLKTVYTRFMDDNHPHAAKYAEILAKAMGWNEPEKIDITKTMEVEVYIGGQRIE
jgi:phage terminase small subunit